MASAVPTIAFDAGSANGVVLPDAGKIASMADFDAAALRFTAPKEAEDKGDSKVCTARAFLLPGKGALRLMLRGAAVAKVTHSRRDAHTVSVAMPPRAGPLQAFLLALDARVLEVAQSSTDAWFMHKMNADLVEEYYRGSTHGTVCRFVVDGTLELPPVVEGAHVDGARVDMVLQLVGLQFRPQYFTCVWKVLRASAAVAVEASDASDASEASDGEKEDAPPPLHKKKTRKNLQFAFEDDSLPSSDNEDDEYVGPTAEQRAELRQSLMEKLMSLESYEQDRIDSLRDMIRVLDSASPDDLGVLGDIDERLAELEG